MNETFVKENSKTPSQGGNIFELLEAVLVNNLLWKPMETKLAICL